ncbi:MAG: asparagine synthase-related protein [Buchananella hordeovulneris]|nr:asparagine synthase-related protein [Buchananella hordeovulneris]
MRRVFVATKDFTGYLEDGQQLSLSALAEPRLGPGSEDELVSAAAGGGLPIGEARLCVTAQELVVVSDIPRSYPLLWTDRGEEILVADSPELLRRAGVELHLDNAAATEFYSCGFVWGQRTLLQGVYQVEGGFTLRIDLETGRSVRALPTFQVGAGQRYATAEEADAAFEAALDKSMHAMVERLGEGRLVIPLSGGLDSRLLLAWLKNHHVDNVLCFTYGIPGSKETEVSRQLAQRAGFAWKLVELHREAVRTAWAGFEAAHFIEYAWGATSLPHVQDWYAINALVKAGVIGGKNDVVLPGHTVIGNLHHEDQLLAGGVDLDRLAAMIYAHHCELDSQLPGQVAQSVRSELAWILQRLKESGRYSGQEDRLLWADAIEMVNIANRQAKYINNSMRAYEAAGLGWDLPMLDAPMWDFAGHISQELAFERSWYRSFVERYYAAATGQTVPEHREQPVSAATTAKIARVMSALRVKGALTRAYATAHVMRHPLGLDMYVGDISRSALAAQLLGGRHLLGIYARQMLAGRWNPLADLGMKNG